MPRMPLLPTLLLFFVTATASFTPCSADPFDDPAELTVGHILDTHSSVHSAPDRLHVELNVLGFATPWNGRGKDIALSESDKGRLNILSPVTYQMTDSGLSGGHDYSDDFYSSVSASGALLMPRVLFEASFFQASSMSAAVAGRALVDACRARGFAGLVIEAWQTMHALSQGGKMTSKGYQFIKAVGSVLREHDLRTAIVMPPFTNDVEQAGVSSSSIKDMSVGYSYVIVMTYDFSTPASQPGPIAPVQWVRMAADYFTGSCGLAGKVLLGLNFYGVDFALGDKSQKSNRHVVAHEFIDTLTTRDPDIKWHDGYKEHYFVFEQEQKHHEDEHKDDDNDSDGSDKRKTDRMHVIFYPTRSSIRERIKIAQDTHCGGVAIWDIGQGLDHFFEEF